MPTFTGILESARGGGAYVLLPPDVLTALDRGLRFRAKGTLNGVAFASSTMPMGGGAACLGVHKATREQAGAAFGDEVLVVIEPDDAPREIVIPEELEAALRASPAARAAFDALAPSHRREYAQHVAEAKQAATRERRAAKAIERLTGSSD